MNSFHADREDFSAKNKSVGGLDSPESFAAPATTSLLVLALGKLSWLGPTELMQAATEILEAPDSRSVPMTTGAATGEELPPFVSIWLVDDNAKFRSLIAELLERRDGIECARQFSSPDALLAALASKPGPDVILLDVQLGERNGLDAVRPIKSLARSTRVLMFTTCYDPEYHQRALAEGASDYLLKGDSLDRLVASIRQSERPGAVRRLRVKRAKDPAPQPVPIKTGPMPCASSPRRPLSKTLEFLRSLWN